MEPASCLLTSQRLDGSMSQIVDSARRPTPDKVSTLQSMSIMTTSILHSMNNLELLEEFRVPAQVSTFQRASSANDHVEGISYTHAKKIKLYLNSD